MRKCTRCKKNSGEFKNCEECRKNLVIKKQSLRDWEKEYTRRRKAVYNNEPSEQHKRLTVGWGWAKRLDFERDAG